MVRYHLNPIEDLLRQYKTYAKKGDVNYFRPQIVSSGPGLTARRMLAVTPRKIFRNAEHVRVNRIRRRKGQNYGLAITTTEPGHATEKQPHYQIVEILSPAGERDFFTRNTKIKISCDCSHFKFRCEAALHKYGAADIIFSNGEPAHQNNPRNIPWLCKHWVSVPSKHTCLLYTSPSPRDS